MAHKAEISADNDLHAKAQRRSDDEIRRLKAAICEARRCLQEGERGTALSILRAAVPTESAPTSPSDTKGVA